MSGFWDILVPSKSDYTNIVTNPSVETATTGYVAIGTATADVSTTRARRGYRSLAVTTSTASADGVAYDNLALTSGVTYRFGVDVWGVNGVPYASVFSTTANVEVGTPTTFTGNGDWQRVIVPWSATATANYRLCVRKNDSEDTGPFYVDGFSCVAASAEPAYFDGDSEDCYWTGTAHASTSVAPGQSRLYGSWVNLDDYGFYVQEIGSVGMPLLENQVQSYAFRPGAQYAGQKVLPRVFLIQGETVGTSRSDYHSKRKDLLDVIKPDYVRGNQEFLLRYTGANSAKPALIKARYDDGFGMGAIDGYSEKIAIRLLSVDPFFYEDGDGSAALTTSDTLSDSSYAVKRVAGTWSNIGAALNENVYDFIQDGKNNVYACGAFTNIGDANGDYIIKIDGTGAISSLGTGLSGGAGISMAIDQNGNLYVGGAFTSAGGVANTARIAMWDGTNWNEVGGGIASGQVNALKFGHDGVLYIAGTFTNHGDANGDYITSWDGSSYASLDTGLAVGVRKLAVGLDGSIYVAMSSNAVGVYKWDGSSFTALDSGLVGGGSGVYSIYVSDNGSLYASGDFTSINGVAANRVAEWNGQEWRPLGTGLNGTATEMASDSQGVLYFGGSFTTAGNVSINNGIALWNGSEWSAFGINLDTVTSVYGLMITKREDIYISGNFTGTQIAPHKNTLTNGGTRSTAPIIVIKRSGGTSATIKRISNFQAGTNLYFDYDLLSGETIYIDCSQRTVTSSFFGNVLGRAIVRNSDFTSFELLPGSNDLLVFVDPVGSPTMTAYATWRINHWGVDGVAA